MEFEKWFKETGPSFDCVWETYLDEIIEGGCIIDHIDIKVYMDIAYKAGQESVKGEK